MNNCRRSVRHSIVRAWYKFLIWLLRRNANRSGGAVVTFGNLLSDIYIRGIKICRFTFLKYNCRSIMPTINARINAKAVAYIPYTLFYGTFVDTPTLGDLNIDFHTLVGVDKDGQIDYMHKNYKSSEHDNLSALQFFMKNHYKYIAEEDEYVTEFVERAGERNQYHDNIHGNVDFVDVQYDRNHSQYGRYNINYVDYSTDPTKFFFPGFIDTHIHASQFPNIGIGLDVPLLDWLSKYTFPLENRFTDANSAKLKFAEDIYTKVIQKTLTNGTTCASYFTTTDGETTNLFGELLLKHGQRGFVGKVCMDHNENYEEDYDTCMDSMSKLVKYIHEINPDGESLVKPIITPRFAPVCSRELMKSLAALSLEHNLPIQTHISENLKEIEWVKELFPEFDSYADVYDKHNLLTKDTILAHAVHLTEVECKLVKERNCSISHCPTSNTFITSGEAPIKRYLYEDGINVSLGTDVSGGFDLSILSVLKHSILVSHHVSMKSDDQHIAKAAKLSMMDAMYMATQGGARAVGLANQIGSFEVGKRFDAQMIDLGVASNVDVFNWQLPDLKSQTQSQQDSDLAHDLLGKWVFSGDDRNCVKVWCNGRLVINKGSRDDRWVMIEK